MPKKVAHTERPSDRRWNRTEQLRSSLCNIGANRQRAGCQLFIKQRPTSSECKSDDDVTCDLEALCSAERSDTQASGEGDNDVEQRGGTPAKAEADAKTAFIWGEQDSDRGAKHRYRR